METKLTAPTDKYITMIAEMNAIYIETGLTPRELLERYKEAVEMLEDAALIIDNHEDGHKDMFFDAKERMLAIIQKSKA